MQIVKIVLKVLVCGLLFFVGGMLGGIVASAVGIPVPDAPAGTTPGTLGAYFFVASLGIGALLAFLAVRLDGVKLERWFILYFFGWVVYSVSTNIEAAIYTNFASASLYKVIMDLFAFCIAGAAAVWLFAPHPLITKHSSPHFNLTAWLARLFIAFAAFPLIYLAFGKIVEPFVIRYYQQGLLELAAPGWFQILTAQLLRSALFLFVGLEIVGRWNHSPIALWAALTASFFLLIGGFYMFQAYWFPVTFRLIHSLEIFAGSLVYAGLLRVLFVEKVSTAYQFPTMLEPINN